MVFGPYLSFTSLPCFFLFPLFLFFLLEKPRLWVLFLGKILHKGHDTRRLICFIRALGFTPWFI